MKTLCTLFVLAALAFAATSAFATNVCGNVSGVWDLSGSPYYVTCNVTVPSGLTLSISPGVRVLFTGHYKFNVYGNLQAVGNAVDSIVFTRAYATEASKWWGIRFYSGADASRLEFCVVEYGTDPSVGAHDGGGGIQTNDCSPTFLDCTVRFNHAEQSGGGIHVQYSNAVIRRCVVHDNSAPYGGGIAVGGSSPVIDHCVVYGNTAGQGGGVGYWGGSGTLTNCTIVGNRGNDAGGIRCCCGSTVTIVSNTIVAMNGPGPGVQLLDGTRSSSFNYCDVSQNQGGSILGSLLSGMGVVNHVNANGTPCDQYHNLFLNPVFADTAHKDYRLVDGSPCIDAADPGSPLDPDGSVADMGALWPPVDSMLAVELTSFSVVPTTAGIAIFFRVATETNNSHFEIWKGTYPAGEFGLVASLPSQGNSSSEHQYEFLDGDVTPGQTFWYYLADEDLSGHRTEHRDLVRSAALAPVALPMEYSLTVYPNPFNPTTNIGFSMAEAGRVSLIVYDITGRLVRTLANRDFTAGSHAVVLDGSDLPAGTYLVRIQSARLTRTQKILLLK